MKVKFYFCLLLILSFQFCLFAQDNISVLISDDQLLITTKGRIRLESFMTEEDAILLAVAQARHDMLDRAASYLYKNNLLSESSGTKSDILAIAFDLITIQQEPPRKIYYHDSPHLSIALMASLNIPRLKSRVSLIQRQAILIDAYRSEQNRTEMLIRNLNQIMSDSIKVKQSIKAFRASEWLLQGIASQNNAAQIQNFDQALSLDPEYAHAHYHRGKSYYQMQVYEKAIEDYNWLIQNNQKWYEVYHLRGLALGQLKQYEQALEDYQTVLTAVRYLPALMNRGVILCKMGQYEKAMEDYQQVLQSDPSNATVYYNMACLYALKGDLLNSLSMLELAMEKGFRDTKTISEDEDLKLISNTDQFRELLEKYRDSGL